MTFAKRQHFSRLQRVYFSNGDYVYVYIRESNLVITVSSDDLAPYGDVPLGDTLLTTELHIFLSKYLRL